MMSKVDNQIGVDIAHRGAISPWVERFISLAPSGRVLDLACGQGRHTAWLLAQGADVLALDRNYDVLPPLKALGADVLLHDLEPTPDSASWPFQENLFSAIIVCNYLHRPLFPYLLSSLTPNGILIYETFAMGNAEYGKPSNPHFLLQPGELFQQTTSNSSVRMQVIAYEDGFVRVPKPAMVQRICARKAAQSSEKDVL